MTQRVLLLTTITLVVIFLGGLLLGSPPIAISCGLVAAFTALFYVGSVEDSARRDGVPTYW